MRDTVVSMNQRKSFPMLNSSYMCAIFYQLWCHLKIKINVKRDMLVICELKDDISHARFLLNEYNQTPINILYFLK